MNFKKWSWAVLFLLLLVSVEGTAFQNKDAQLDKEALFQLLDRDIDGRINIDEFQIIWQDKEAAKDAFKSLDVNRDGYLSNDEFGKAGTVLLKW